MRASYIRCFLIFLLVSAQADDTWTISSVSPAPSQTDDDEYLPIRQDESRQQCDSRHISAVLGKKPEDRDAFLVESNSPYWPKLTRFIASPSLYVFMSLQR
jgi:hypothetical protein